MASNIYVCVYIYGMGLSRLQELVMHRGTWRAAVHGVTKSQTHLSGWQEYCSGLPFPFPVDLPDLGIKPRSPALWADSLPSETPGKPINMFMHVCVYMYILEKEMTTHSSILAWRIPWTEEPGGLWSIGS